MSSLTLSIIQTDLAWEDKKANLDNLSRKIDAIKERTEVILLPEMFSTAFSMQPELLAEDMSGETVSWMKKTAREKKVILSGSVMIRDAPDPATGGPRFYNRLIWMLPNGEYGLYDKRHLFAYANEHAHFTAGHKRLIASVNGWKINLQVCYDLRFPVWSRQSPDDSGGGAAFDVLVYVASWPQQRSHAWRTLLMARAIENQCYVIGVNRTGTDGQGIRYNGGSMIIDPLGEIIFNRTEDEIVFTHTLKKEKLLEVREKFPFWKDADSFIINI